MEALLLDAESTLAAVAPNHSASTTTPSDPHHYHPHHVQFDIDAASSEFPVTDDGAATIPSSGHNNNNNNNREEEGDDEDEDDDGGHDALAQTSTTAASRTSNNNKQQQRYVSQGGSRKRNRGHRAQSHVWKFLTPVENPHKVTVSVCMHCGQNVPHHRKSEKARAHLNRCGAFRKQMSKLAPEDRPNWIEVDAKKRKTAVVATDPKVKNSPMTPAPALPPVTPGGPAHASALIAVHHPSARGLRQPQQPREQGALALAASAPSEGPVTSAPNGAILPIGQSEHETTAAPARPESTSSSTTTKRRTTSSGGHDAKKPAKKPTNAGVTKLHDALAMYFYMTGTPFSSIDDVNLQLAFRLSNPDVVLPSAGKLAGSLLDKAYGNVQTKVNAVLDAFEYNSIATNGWSHPQHQSAPSPTDDVAKGINYMVVNEQHTFLIETSFAGIEQRQDPDFLAHKMISIMNRCGHKISGVVTDNTAANQVMWSKLKTVFPNRFFHGCASHGLHLFVQDIFSPMRNRTATTTHPGRGGDDSCGFKYPDGYPFEALAQLAETCRRIVTVFLQDEQLHVELSRLLRETHVPMVHFPSSRHEWRHLKTAFQSLHAAYKVVRLIVSGREFVMCAPGTQYEARLHIQQQILQPGFLLLVEKAIAILHPLDRLMSLFESDTNVPCSEVFYVFAKALPDELLKIPGLTKSEQTYLLILNQTRFNVMYGDAHGIAYLLDPRYIGDGLNTDVRKNIEDIIFDLPVKEVSRHASNNSNSSNAKLDIAQQLTEYVIDATREKNNNTFRYTLLVKHKKTALQYWLTDGQRWPLLQQIACKVFSLPSSTVAVERKLTAKATLPAALRAALPPAVVGKLMFIKGNSESADAGTTARQQRDGERPLEARQAYEATFDAI